MSFFSFQDVMMCTIGVTIVITMVLILQIGADAAVVEAMDEGIGRVLREDLVGRGAAGAVLAAGVRGTEGDPDFTLVVRVLACEGGANGAVHFRAVWELATTGSAPKVVARGDVQPGDLRWDGKSEAALVAQLSKAVGALTDDVAGGLARSGK